MASDLWEKVKKRFRNTVMENTEAGNLVQSKESRDRLNTSKNFEQNVDWTDFEKYFAKDEYIKFLKNTKTEQSLQVYEEHKIEDAKYKNILERALQQMKVSDKDEKESKFTHRSEAHSRTSSNSSSVAIRKRAKAEAAQAKLEFAMKEADLQKQKAYIEGKKKLQVQRHLLKG
ncbi:unnamed protein product [Mytilus coruscus]|uniref:Uncharacterized protein n=1 Tax=Mytilus coruscus TaxID=42192 RepID=A0A6J8ADQ5_MYTCO|nr:unnamed protein product [Mytilus coruscus]